MILKLRFRRPRRKHKTLLVAALSLWFCVVSCDAFAQTLPLDSSSSIIFDYKVGNRRGSFRLSPYTMQSLLESGYTITSVERHTAQDIELSLAFYLQKGPILFRCSEEGKLYSSVLCWVFNPVIGEIEGKQQIPIENFLSGTWEGSLQPSREQPSRDALIVAHIDVSDLALDPNITYNLSGLPAVAGSLSGKLQVIYFDQSGAQITVHVVRDLHIQQTSLTFEIQTVDKIVWRDPPYSQYPIILARKKK